MFFVVRMLLFQNVYGCFMGVMDLLALHASALNARLHIFVSQSAHNEMRLQFSYTQYVYPVLIVVHVK